MATYKNFFETLAEARARVGRCIVMYDGQPVYIWAISDHKSDGAFRVYISPIEEVSAFSGMMGFPGAAYPHNYEMIGQKFDAWMDANKTAKLQRKKMDSPLFNKFRPFPLGMVNVKDPNNQTGLAYYVERTPIRPKMEQGLTSGAVFETPVTAAQNRKQQGHMVNMYSKEFRDCIMGEYPRPREVLEKLSSGLVANESVAFHRNFALVRGPVEILFLAYKGEVVGVLPMSDFNTLKLGKEYRHLKEAVEELNLFYTIK